MLVSAVAFGTMPALATWAYEGKTGTETLLFLRFVISFVIVGLVAVRAKRTFPTGRTLQGWILLGVVLYTAQSYSFFAALKHAPAALVSILLYLYPVIVAGLSVAFLRERVTPLRFVSLCLAVGGAALAVGPVAGAQPVGVAWGLAAAVFYSIYLVIGAGLLRNSDGVASSVVIMGAAAVTYAVFASIVGWHFPENAVGWLGSIGLALSSAIALALLFAGMEIIGPIDASTLSAVEPIVTASLGFIFFGQNLAVLQYIGGGLILLAAILVVRSSHKRAQIEARGDA